MFKWKHLIVVDVIYSITCSRQKLNSYCSNENWVANTCKYISNHLCLTLQSVMFYPSCHFVNCLMSVFLVSYLCSLSHFYVPCLMSVFPVSCLCSLSHVYVPWLLSVSLRYVNWSSYIISICIFKISGMLTF